MSDDAIRTSAVSWLTDRVRLILAPNPSPMTLEGTNTYLIGDDRSLIVMDPGPDDDGHIASIEAAVAGANVSTILLTHKHIDHAEVAERCAELFDAPIASNDGPRRKGDRAVVEGDRIDGLTAVATPGHSSDHLCFVLEGERTLFSGDHILGRGTTVVAHPDGDMGEYFASLERLRGLALDRIFPGHGPVIADPKAVIEEYIEHRHMRERQVVDGLSAAGRPVTPEELVARIYADVDPVLHPVAAMSVRAHLAKLAREGRAVQDDGERWRPS
jgi:glyoxylase-like metal-dependent hydrolase (beta-lactamase superfamily II)